MVPPGGAGRFSPFGWTLQPTGTRFDPPIEVRIPNVDGFKPGITMPVVQWDHDLAQFVPMGLGTVTADGTQLITEPGSGITKAGWGGGQPPPPPTNDADNQCPSSRAGDNCVCDNSKPEVVAGDWTISEYVVHFNEVNKFGNTLDFNSGVGWTCELSSKCNTYKIIGHPGLREEIKIAKNLPIPSVPGTYRDRTATQINQTKVHERVHADKKQDLQNLWYEHNSLIGEWFSMQECNVALVELEQSNQNQYNIVHYRECMHFNHAGEKMQTIDAEGNQIDHPEWVYPLKPGYFGYENCQNLPQPHE
jgi:hypothetical protein